MQRILLLLVLGFTHTFSLKAQYCSDDRFTAVDYFSDAEVITEINILYGLADDWFMEVPQPNLNAFDIAYPDPAIDPMEKRPLVFLAHGGGFWGGEKEAFAYHLNELAKSGFVVVAPNYRKGWMGSPMDCAGDPASLQLAIYRAMQDVHACLRYLVANAGTYGIDTSKIFAGGESAGVYATLNSIYVSQEEWEAQHPGYEAMYGPIIGETNNIVIDVDVKGFINMWGGVYDTSTISVDELRPTVSFYGYLDDVIPPMSGTIQSCENFEIVTGSAGIAQYLSNNGVCSYTHANPTQGHEAYAPAYTIDHIACFVKSVLCGICETDEVFFGEASCADNYTGGTTGIEDQAATALTMFPNPATTRINSLLSGEWTMDAQAALFDASGKMMDIPVQRTGNTLYADVQSLPAGLYLIQVIDGNRSASGVFMVSH